MLGCNSFDEYERGRKSFFILNFAEHAKGKNIRFYRYSNLKYIGNPSDFVEI
jgi:hypothetical protein